jgi:hypothetical protein
MRPALSSRQPAVWHPCCTVHLPDALGSQADPQHVKAWYRLAQSLARLHRYPEALAAAAAGQDAALKLQDRAAAEVRVVIPMHHALPWDALVALHFWHTVVTLLTEQRHWRNCAHCNPRRCHACIRPWYWRATQALSKEMVHEQRHKLCPCNGETCAVWSRARLPAVATVDARRHHRCTVCRVWTLSV